MTCRANRTSQLLIALLFSGFFIACHSEKVIRPDRPQVPAGVRMQDVHFESAALGRQMTYRVFLPAKVDPNRKFSVVYLLHGNYGSFRDWSNDSDVAIYVQHGLLLVMPEGDSSYYMNEVEAPREKYGDYLTADLIADVEARFPVRSDRGGRAIIGVSMGGFAAIECALARPDLYSFAGALSPAIDVPSRGFNIRRVGQWWRFRKIFGPIGSAERRARDPFIQVQSVQPSAIPYLYVTAGEDEPLLGPIRKFVLDMRQRGFAFEFHTRPGGHNWSEWDKQIPGCFTSLMKHLRTGGDALSSRSSQK